MKANNKSKDMHHSIGNLIFEGVMREKKGVIKEHQQLNLYKEIQEEPDSDSGE
jgi:hypothetical protein